MKENNNNQKRFNYEQKNELIICKPQEYVRDFYETSISQAKELWQTRIEGQSRFLAGFPDFLDYICNHPDPNEIDYNGFRKQIVKLKNTLDDAPLPKFLQNFLDNSNSTNVSDIFLEFITEVELTPEENEEMVQNDFFKLLCFWLDQSNLNILEQDNEYNKLYLIGKILSVERFRKQISVDDLAERINAIVENITEPERQQLQFLIYFYEFNINCDTVVGLKKKLFEQFLGLKEFNDLKEIEEKHYTIDGKICIFPLYLFLGLAEKYRKELKTQNNKYFENLQRAITCFLQFGFYKEARYYLRNHFLPQMINMGYGVDILYKWLSEDNIDDFDKNHDIEKIISNLNEQLQPEKEKENQVAEKENQANEKENQEDEKEKEKQEKEKENQTTVNEFQATSKLINYYRTSICENKEIVFEDYKKNIITVLKMFTKALTHDRSVKFDDQRYNQVCQLLKTPDFLEFDTKQNNYKLINFAFKRMVLSAFLLNGVSIEFIEPFENASFLPKDIYSDAKVRQAVDQF